VIPVQKSRFKKSSFEDKFSRKYACWAYNHGGWGKYKTANRRMARRKLKQETNMEIQMER
jgi:hypothetical protein